MPKQTNRKKETAKYQAVCSRGDFVGDERETPGRADKDARDHNEEPGCANHIVKVNLVIRHELRSFLRGVRR